MNRHAPLIGIIFLILLIVAIVSAIRFVFGTGEMDMGFRIIFVCLMLFLGWIGCEIANDS